MAVCGAPVFVGVLLSLAHLLRIVRDSLHLMYTLSVYPKIDNSTEVYVVGERRFLLLSREF